MAKKIGELVIGIGADVTDLVAGSKTAQEAMSSIGGKARELATEMTKAAVAATAAGAAIAAAFVKSGLDAIDAQAKLARSLDASIDGLRTLQLAMEGAGVSSEEAGDILRQFNQRLGDAQRGSGAAFEALNALGLSARDLANMDADKRVAAVAERINELGLSGSQAADLLRDLGIKNENLATLMRQGGAAFDEAREKLEKFGLSVSDIDAAKVEAANDAIADMQLAFEAVRNVVAVEFAPIIEALATKFNTLAKENGGFGQLAIGVARNVALAFGKVGDVVQGISVVFKGVQLVAEGAGATLVTIAEGAANIFVTLIDTVTRAVNQIIHNLNAMGAELDALPLLGESEFVASMRQAAEDARVHVGTVRDELHTMAMQTLPSENVTKFFDDVSAAAQKSAEEAANASKKLRDDAGNSTFDPEARKRTDDILAGMPALNPDDELKKLVEANEKKFMAEQEALQKRLDAVRQFTENEYTQEVNAQRERLAALAAGREAGLVQDEDFKARVEQIEQLHADKLKSIREKNMTDLEKFQASSFGAQVKTAVGAFEQMTAGISKQSKIAFELNKIAGIANVALKIPEAVQNAYTWGSSVGGPYAGAAAAAIALAASLANLAAIKSQSFGGSGGSAPSLAGSTPAPPVTPVGNNNAAPSRNAGLLVVEGISSEALFTGRVVRELAMKLSDFSRDGGQVEFA